MLHQVRVSADTLSVLADGVVRFAGECVAAAVAPTEEEAEDIVDPDRDRDRRAESPDRQP